MEIVLTRKDLNQLGISTMNRNLRAKHFNLEKEIVEKADKIVYRPGEVDPSAPFHVEYIIKDGNSLQRELNECNEMAVETYENKMDELNK